ncbi:hypothetical protein LDDCCGHA_2092 [Methylobacterium oxalidis]|nr:hypothetical protein LDDCCGHA_2092 [Methylobacterium oxalidis]
MGREVGHVERPQHRFRRGRVVVGRAADEGEARQRDEGVDARATAPAEEGLHRRAVVEAAREGRNHRESPRLEARDHAVVMRGVARKHVGSHQQEADPADHRPARTRQRSWILADAARHTGVIQAGLGIAERRGRRRDLPPGRPLARCVAADEEAHEARHVLVRARQPVLEREEVGPHVLRRARDEAEYLREVADQCHLATGIALGRSLRAQPLQKIEGAALRPVHVEAVEPGRAHDLSGREAADHGVAMGATREQGRQDGADVLVHEQHRAQDDIGPRDVGAAGLDRGRIGLPVRGGVEAEGEARHLRREGQARALHGARQVIVERHDDDADVGPLNGRNALWHRTGSRW